MKSPIDCVPSFSIRFPHQNTLKCKVSFIIVLFTVRHLVSIPKCISRVTAKHSGPSRHYTWLNCNMVSAPKKKKNLILFRWKPSENGLLVPTSVLTLMKIISQKCLIVCDWVKMQGGNSAASILSNKFSLLCHCKYMGTHHQFYRTQK